MVRTSVLTNYKNSRGLTMIEVMIVIAIIGGVLALAIPKINNPNNQIRGTLRELATLSRELHTRAKLNGKTYRLVFQLKSDDPREANQAQAYYIESSTNQVLLMKSEDEKEYLERRARDIRDEKGKNQDPYGFSPDASILKKPKVLPAGLEIESVELKRAKTPVSTGKVGIHYFPQGMSEEAIVHFKTKDQEWSLIIDPMLGKAAMVGRKVTLKDIGSQ